MNHPISESCAPCADGEHADDGTGQNCPCCGVWVPAAKRVEISDANLSEPIVHFEDWTPQTVHIMLLNHSGRWWTDCPGTTGAVLLGDPSALMYDGVSEAPTTLVDLHDGVTPL